jgi:hypothetical protein
MADPLFAVLLAADLFHPVDNLTVELFLNGNVRHGRGGRGAMPVLFAGREPDHITGPDLLDRSAVALGPAKAGRHNERLTERMRMPRGPGTRLERDAGALNQCRIRRLKKRIDPYRAREPLRRPLLEGCEPTLLISMSSNSSLRGLLNVCRSTVDRSRPQSVTDEAAP